MNSEKQEKLEAAKIHLDFMHTALMAKTGALPMVASLSATVLVVATFNKDLLEITPFLKIVLCLLLGLIPFSLFFYILELSLTIGKHKKSIEKIMNISDLMPKKGFFNTTLNYLFYLFPFFGTFALAFVMAYIIFAIWR